ncbi:MAG TPA: nuclear transport factor 2 family protein [Thermoanaerobaculia bacterium]|nr:nuclear transport factor 2 family protein [Thermoanaerobaculia bacterium]
MDIKQVGDKLVELCKQGKHLEAIDAIYDKNIVSVEAMSGGPDMPAEMHGIDAIRGKNEWWLANHEVHSGDAKGPYVNGDRFAVDFNFDITPKVGPMEGKRHTMQEVALYTVKDGKIVREEFFY